jgi:hypothetical protein
MAECTGQPVIHATKGLTPPKCTRDYPPRHGKAKGETLLLQRQPENVICDLCGAYGHRKIHCDLSVKVYNILHNMKLLDPKDKSKMDEFFKTAQVHRKMNHKSKQHIATVQSLVKTGDLDAAIDLWDEAMQYDELDYTLDSSEDELLPPTDPLTQE